MKILVTAGGTAERIDDVRSITNHATGALGATIADMFASYSHDVILITTTKSVKPKNKHIIVKYVTDINSTKKMILDVLSTNQFDAVVHSMAIGDYQIESILDEDNQEIVDRHKISSKNSIQLVLKPAPKMIKYFKEKQPNCILVGFKLLSNASENSLYEVAYESLIENQSDFVFANDFKKISRKKHVGYLIDKAGNKFYADGKYSISKLIYEKVSVYYE